MSRASGLPSGCQPAWLKRSCRALIGLAYRGHDVKGIENMPLSGPVIVAATHRSYLDPILMSAFLPRTLYFMGKRELFNVPVLGAVIRRFGAIPIDRQGARGQHVPHGAEHPETRRRLGDFSRRRDRRFLQREPLQSGGGKLGQLERGAHSPGGHHGLQVRAQAALGRLS